MMADAVPCALGALRVFFTLGGVDIGNFERKLKVSLLGQQATICLGANSGAVVAGVPPKGIPSQRQW